MIRILIALLLTTAAAAEATPFLVCDPYPSGQDQFMTPVSFNVTGIGANPISVPATINVDGTRQLHYDVGTLGNGNFTVTAAAVNVFGGTSPESSPFSFTKGVPTGPTGLKLSPL